MTLIRTLLFLALASPAAAQSYLVEPSLPSAQARSAAQCAALGCVENTQYWWSVQPLTDGTAAVVIEPSGAYSQQTTVGSVTAGLTSAEIAALKTADQIAPLLPQAQ